MRQIRKATGADASGIANLYSELTSLSPVRVEAERIDAVAQDNNTYLMVVADDDELIATALVVLANDVMFARQPFAVVENFIVSKDYQRQGVGKSLMDHIEEFCIAQDCSKIMLLSGSDNSGAHDFYTAMGFDPDAKLGFIKYRRYFGQ